jgi:xanthine dehydrogenase small subunit
LIQFILNDQTIECRFLPGATLLDIIRYHQQLTGTKFGCRKGDCGACTVLAGELVNDKLQNRGLTSAAIHLKK